MASVTKHPGTITQTTGGKFRDFKNLNNIKNTTTGSYAVSNGNIRGKSGSPNRPSTLTLKNFGFNLPNGAEVTKVTVTYRHKKTGSGGHTLNIPAPTLTLLGTGSNTFTKKGAAPTTSMVTHNYAVSTSKITRAQVNSSNFGVKIDYPTNTNSYEGTVSISYVRVTVEYKTSSYGVTVKKTSGGYNGEDYTVQLNISNKNLTGYNPTLTLTTPLGFNYKSFNGTGTISQVNARTFTWNPKLTSKVGTSSVNLTFGTNVTFPTGSDTYTGTFTLVESLNSTTANHTATITVKPTTPEEETESGEEIIDDEGQSYRIQFVRKGEPFKLAMQLTEEERSALFGTNPKAAKLQVFPNPHFEVEEFENADKLSWYDPDMSMSNSWVIQEHNVDENGNIIFAGFDSIIFDDYTGVTFPTEISLVLFKGDVLTTVETTTYIVRNLKIHVVPKETQLTPPYLSLLSPSEEECDRLGSGYTYIAQTYMEHTTTDAYERDWYKNNRIGVFNNAIEDNITIVEEEDPETGEIIEVITDSTDYDNLTPMDIFTYAEYWSSALTNIGEYENLECEFTYNKNYPLYIIMTGDYPEAELYNYDVGEVSFTEPCIIEKEAYKEREPNGNYPTPIKDLIDYEESEDTATITLGAYESATSVILYDLDLDEGYGTNDDIAIRGVQVRATIESTDNLVVYAKLKTPDGNIGQRSIVLDDLDSIVDSDNELVIGGLGDLWGFNTLDMVNLEDWELDLSATNLLSNDDSTLNFSDVKIIFYIEKVEKQDITVKIEGENLAYYGAFIVSDGVSIPEGLETDTSFLNIDGTDNNDAYRQNIKEKAIGLEFTIDDCDLQTNTDMLRQITKLIVNEKDKYNRPIPKRIEFSHRPHEYFEYIVEDAFDVTEEMGGYKVNVKLTVPAGTSYSKDDTVTNTVGYVQGLAAVRPVITFKPSDEIIRIVETVSEQSFNMGYSGDWNSKVVEIDCDNRKVFLKIDEDDPNPVDISKYVDHNVDWFRLHGEFNFESTNCVIRTVTFNERW